MLFLGEKPIPFHLHSSKVERRDVMDSKPVENFMVLN